ncbi:MAG: PAS domain S-box protein [Ignavibacteriales bacterium]|nr:PAS domain S-box protein [Ignavibacteriales bacterium]
MTGYQRKEVAGEALFRLKSGNPTLNRDMIIAQVKKTGEVSNLQIEYLYKDGTTRYGLFSAKEMEFSGRKCLLSIVTDITDRVEMEIELRDAKEKAEELNRVKASFFANMSHELRTPLHGVLGFSEILIEEITEPGTLEVVNSIHKSALRLLNTLNIILDLARLEANKEEVIIIDMLIYKAVKEDVDTFEAYAKSKGLYLELFTDDPEICAMVDPRFLSSIVNNLINNAIKFTRFGGIKVETGSVEEGGVKWAYLKVSDTGIGISEKAITLIFDEFRQASEGFGRSFEGTGLGLSIVKRYVTLLGGKILVDSKLGKGTTFTVLLPYCEKKSLKKKFLNQTEMVL